MAKVFVRWYDKVLEGETNGTVGMFGMLEVKIQVQGMKASALYAPEHVYESAELAAGNHTEISVSAPKVAEKPREISRNESEISIVELSVLKFKEENLDYQRNHLRIDALDKFYQLWRDNMALRLGTRKPKPAMKMEYPLTPDEATVTLPSHKPQPIVSDKRMAELKTQLKKSLKPVEAIQLSLFD